MSDEYEIDAAERSAFYLRQGCIRHINDDTGEVFVELFNDIVRILEPGELEGLSEVRVGDVVLYDENEIFAAPERFQKAGMWIGIIHQILDTEVIVSISGLLKAIPHSRKSELQLEIGNTVKGNDAKIIAVVADHPLRHMDDPAEDRLVSQYLVEPDPDGQILQDIGGYESVKEQVTQALLLAEKRGQLTAMGVPPTKGILLTGPPGTGKTMLVRAIANTRHAKLYHVRGPEISHSYVGQTERVLRRLFDEAKGQTPPAVIFFDEIDSIGGDRNAMTHEHSRSIITQFLTLLDGLVSDNTFVIAATNRQHALDSAMLRPGRLHPVVEFELPDEVERAAIIKTASRKHDNGTTAVPVSELVDATDTWSPAEVSEICHTAARIAILEERTKVLPEDYMVALEEMRDQKRHSEVVQRTKFNDQEGRDR